MLLDSSAWIEYLRATESSAHLAVRSLIRGDASITTCEPVVLEVLAGGRSEPHVVGLERLLARTTLLTTQPTDWTDAARIYRTGRRQGLTVRRPMDCLIAAVALRTGESILHYDADFETIARVVPLSVTRG